jgi:hypothetical protein
MPHRLEAWRHARSSVNRRHALSDAQCPLLASDRRPTRESIDWLEGATGVSISLVTGEGLLTITVEGELDRASLEVLQSVALRALDYPLARVELDLRAVSFFGLDTIDATSVVAARARARQRPFLLSAPWTQLDHRDADRRGSP